ncbi:MAG: single-stranded-DNA-specific exonuclease RecJ [Candidatus Margulisiibacteriota bacterium]
MNKLWKIFKPEDDLAQALSQELKISSLTAQVLINRGIRSVGEADMFLNPRLNHLCDPMEIPDVDRAARRVLLAKEKGEKILVFGDYDVDGVTGTVILLHTLKYLGIDASYYIPHRYGEGYSLSLESVKRIAESGIKLIVTVDCGISNFNEIEEANALGMEVVVTDHHNLAKNLPPAYAIVNPKMISKEHPSRNLSGAGVAFKFAWALLRIANVKNNEFLTSLLDLASLGTVSDVVPLTAENRVLAVAGLNLINERKRLGIKHLAQAASLYGKISVNHIYFGLAPRINAAGRLEHASKAVELLLTNDADQAKALAEELHRINLRRRGIGSSIKEEVFSKLDENYLAENKLVILSGEDWHPGVIGIVASQIVDRYLRPAVLVGINDGVGRGSARSVDGLNMFELLDSCRDLFLDFGGHEGAAGFEIAPENILELKDRLREEIERVVSAEDLKPKIAVDAELSPSKISMSLIKELEVLDPHGEGNPPPVFMSRKLNLFDMRRVGTDGRHLKLKFTDGKISLDTIGFDLGGLADKLSYDKSYDIAYKLETNEWNGFETAQLSLIDIREAKP